MYLHSTAITRLAVVAIAATILLPPITVVRAVSTYFDYGYTNADDGKYFKPVELG